MQQFWDNSLQLVTNTYKNIMINHETIYMNKLL